MRILLTLGVVSIALLSSGCGGIYYAISINSAEAKVEQARAMGAEKSCPYEYYYAREHLHEARVHAYEASYGDASDMAETAETYAQKAIDRIAATKRGTDPDTNKDKDDKDDDTSSGWGK